jgi:hypothetical protein
VKAVSNGGLRFSGPKKSALVAKGLSVDPKTNGVVSHANPIQQAMER